MATRVSAWTAIVLLGVAAAGCGGSSAAPAASGNDPASSAAAPAATVVPTGSPAALPAALTSNYGYAFPKSSPKAPGGLTLSFVDGGHAIIRGTIDGQPGTGGEAVTITGHGLTFMSTGNDGFCQVGQAGAYRWAVKGDRLALHLVHDACLDRRTWLTAYPLVRQ